MLIFRVYTQKNIHINEHTIIRPNWPVHIFNIIEFKASTSNYIHIQQNMRFNTNSHSNFKSSLTNRRRSCGMDEQLHST